MKSILWNPARLLLHDFVVYEPHFSLTLIISAYVLSLCSLSAEAGY